MTLECEGEGKRGQGSCKERSGLEHNLVLTGPGKTGMGLKEPGSRRVHKNSPGGGVISVSAQMEHQRDRSGPLP